MQLSLFFYVKESKARKRKLMERKSQKGGRRKTKATPGRKNTRESSRGRAESGGEAM